MSSSGRSARRDRSKKDRVRVLFTCVGRRVELIKAFRLAAKRLDVRLDVHGGDANRLSPALHHVDKVHIVPPISSGRYVAALTKIVQKERIDLLIPLIDPELPLLAGAIGRFADLGCCALISPPAVVTTCQDKLASYEALKAAGIDTPKTWPWTEATTRKKHPFPLFLKPRVGSAAMGNYIIRNSDELRTFGRRVPDAIVQEFVDGAEHTLDVYAGFDGAARCVVPRKRLEVRTGEVSKGLIVKNPAVMAVGARVVEMLGDCRGVVTVQCIVTKRRRIRVIEINPRFGGGAPLSIYAGADFPKWILAGLLGRRVRIGATAFKDDMAMLRYDESVFVPNASKRR